MKESCHVGQNPKGEKASQNQKEKARFRLAAGLEPAGRGRGSPEYEIPFKRKIQNLLIHSFIYSFFHASIHLSFHLFFFNFKNCVYLFLAAPGLCCCTGFSLVVELRRGASPLVAVCGLLPAAASLTEHRLRVSLWSAVSIVAAHRFLLRGTWDLPGTGIKPLSPASVGKFFTSEPQGKLLIPFIKNVFHSRDFCRHWKHSE